MCLFVRDVLHLVRKSQLSANSLSQMNRTVVKFGPETETKEQLLVPEDLVKTERESPDQTAQV